MDVSGVFIGGIFFDFSVKDWVVELAITFI